MKHATSLRLYMLPGPALIQADLDYQWADVDKKIQQYVGTSEDPLPSLIRLLSQILKLVQFRWFVYSFVCSNHTKPLFPILGVTNVHKKGLLLVTMVFGTDFLTHDTIILVGR